MMKRFLFVCFLISATAGVTQAELVMSIGDYSSSYAAGDSSTWNRIEIQAGSGQLLEVNIRDTTGQQQLSGANLLMFIGDGDGPLSEPVFRQQDGDEFSNGIFGGQPYFSDGPGPLSGEEMYYERNVFPVDSTVTVSAAGLLATIEVDATGFAGKTFEVYLDWGVGSPSSLAGPSAEPLKPDLQHAVISVVPEPSCLVLALCGLGIVPLTLGRMRKRRA